MRRIKDLFRDVSGVEEVMATMQTVQGTVSSDLYDSIKEVAELKYRIVELELRLSNLEATVKILNDKGGL